MNDVILVAWHPSVDLDRIFPEKTARQLSGLLPIRGMLTDYGAEGGLMSCLVGGERTQIPVRLDELTEVVIS